MRDKKTDLERLVAEADQGLHGLGALAKLTIRYGSRLEKLTQWLLILTGLVLALTLIIVWLEIRKP